MNKQLTKLFICISCFAIAMGYMEASIVVYLRELYYPNGFNFPLNTITGFIGKVEIAREAATVIMLVCVGYLAGTTRLQRFAYFVLSFAIWDLVYYLGLYITLGWPSSLFTWDILFLIPVPWVGPVWSPCLIALLMIIGSVHVIIETNRSSNFSISRKNWFLVWAGCSICLVTFMWDYIQQGSTQQWLDAFIGDGSVFNDLKTYIPKSFNSIVFLTGSAIIAFPIFQSIYYSSKKIKL